MWRVKVAFAFFPSTYFHYAYYEGQMNSTDNNVRVLDWEHGATNFLFHVGQLTLNLYLKSDETLRIVTKTKNFAES